MLIKSSYTILALCFVLSLKVDSSEAVKAKLPPGSYQNTCRDCEYLKATDIDNLSCYCQKEDGDYPPWLSNLTNPFACKADIKNCHPNLSCGECR